MTGYQPMSAPPPERSGRPSRGEPPQSVRSAARMLYGIAAVAVLSTILTVLYRDDIVEATMEAANDDSLTADQVRTTVLVMSVVMMVLYLMVSLGLAMFMLRGAGWARVVATVLAVIGLALAVLNLTGGGTLPQLLLSILDVALMAGLLYFSWRPESSEYFR